MNRDLLHGDLVMKRFGSIRELKNIRPVEEVRGRIVGGPFTYAQAVRRAGVEVVNKILNRRKRNARRRILKPAINSPLGFSVPPPPPLTTHRCKPWPLCELFLEVQKKLQQERASQLPARPPQKWYDVALPPPLPPRPPPRKPSFDASFPPPLPPPHNPPRHNFNGFNSAAASNAKRRKREIEDEAIKIRESIAKRRHINTGNEKDNKLKTENNNSESNDDDNKSDDERDKRQIIDAVFEDPVVADNESDPPGDKGDESPANPPPPLIRGGIIDEADTAEQVKREMTDRGILKENIQSVEGEVVARGKEEIGRIKNVVDPIGLLQQLGPQRVSKLEVRSGEVLAGDEDKLNVVRGDPVEIAAGLYR